MKKTLSLILFLFSMNAFAQIPTNGLVGYWPFDGNANDMSGFGNNGTVFGATPAIDRFGIANSAYFFDGISNYIEILDSPSLNQQNGITLCAWYRAADFVGNGYSAIIDKGFTSHSSPTYQYKLGAGAAFGNSYFFGYSISVNGVENRLNTVNQFWEENNWYFLVGTFDGTVMKFFVNNQLITTDTVAGTLDMYNTPLYFGNNTTANDFLKGTIDDIRIYDRALDSTELSQLYNENICKVYVSVTDTLFINTGISGFDPITYENSIKIYPNPTNDHITIDNGNWNLLSGYQIKIFNSLNQVMFQTQVNTQQFYIPLNTWTGNGIYFVHLIDGQGNTIDIRKIVIQ